MVKPGGTGSPRLAISARLAPLPPSKARNRALPSALASAKGNTHWPEFGASAAGLLATTLLEGFGAGLAGPFARALRAGGAAFTRAGMDGFDFAAIFFVFATALAMTCKQSARGGEVARLTPLWAVPRKVRRPGSTLHGEPLEHAQTDQADANQIDRDHEIEQPRHDQNEDTGDQGHYGRNVRSGDGHRNLSGMRPAGNRIETCILSSCTVPR